MKTQIRPLEIVSKLGKFSVEVSCLLAGRYLLVSQSITSHVVFEGDFWSATDEEFSHSLGRKRTVISLIFEPTERPLLGKTDIHEKGRYESGPLLALVRVSGVFAHP